MTTRPTSTERKKQRERSLFDRVRPFIHEWPDGAVDDLGEEPDIVIDAPGRRVGIEVTETINGPLRAESESRRIACEEAHLQYQAATGVVGLAVSVIFRYAKLSAKGQRVAATAALVQLVRDAFPVASGEVFRKRLEITVSPAAQWFQTVSCTFIRR